MPKRLLYVVNDPQFFLSHRLPIAVAAVQNGYDVHVATGLGSNNAVAKIGSCGLTHHTINLSRSGVNPLAELRTISSLYKLMRAIRPSVVHLVTIKPVLYGGIAARLCRVPAVVAAVSGLGSVFVSQGLRARILRLVVGRLYKLALGHPNLRAIFQNPDDRQLLVDIRSIDVANTELIRGSGVVLDEYDRKPEPVGICSIVFASRLLREKGIEEFVCAARTLRERGIQAQFKIVGDVDPGNPSSVTEQALEAWKTEGIVEFEGYRQDMPCVLAASNLLVLPSYREGLPKILAEGAAAGRAVVTTNVPGCRDAIVPGVTGLLVPPKDSLALANAIQALVEDPQRRAQMGEAGRALAEKEFDINEVVDRHLNIYRALEARA